MSERRCREIRRRRVACGRSPKPEATYNRTELPDTREQRRTKKFRKKTHAFAEREASVRRHVQYVAKWRAAFSAKPKNEERKAA